jgi:hypothetical protein
LREDYGDGRFYTLLSLFEDGRRPASLFWDTRTNRVTEGPVVARQAVPPPWRERQRPRVGGWSDTAASAGEASTSPARTRHDQPSDHDRGRLRDHDLRNAHELETELPRFVRENVGPLLVVFDFYAVDDSILDDIANDFVAGNVR